MHIGNLPKKLSYIILAIITAGSFFLMLSVSRQEPPVGDELVHTAAGYGYAKYLDYRLNPEHPPLVKLFSGIPLVFMNLKFPIHNESWVNGVNDQYAAGKQFFYALGNDADKIIQWARVGPMIITLLLILFVYWWSRKLVGSWWALIPAFITALSPTILTHGHYVTTDIGAALGILLSIYFFIEAYAEPTKKNIVFAGLTFGLAQLFKFSAIILIPHLILLAGIFFVCKFYGRERSWKEFWKCFARIIAIFTVGFATVYVVYFVVTFNYPIEKQHSDTRAIFATFAGGETPGGARCNPARCVADLDIWASGNPVLRPLAHYALGVSMVLRRAEGGGPAYFLGEVSREGRLSYFPLVYLMKEPLPIIMFIALATMLLIAFGARQRMTGLLLSVKNHPAEFALILFAVIYMVLSMRSPLNIGIRHLIPAIIPLYIAGTSCIAHWSKKYPEKNRILGLSVVILIMWFGVETARTYPYYLSYFNQVIGTENGWKYVTDSNYDWGQDLKRLKTFIDENNIEKIAVDFVGAGDPIYYLGDTAEIWWSKKGNPKNTRIEWLAVSIDAMQGARAQIDASEKRTREDEYSWLSNHFEPYAVVGTSIFIYKL